MTREEEFQLKTIEGATPPMREEDRDLGFGAKVATESRLRFLNRDGTFNVRRMGIRQFSTRNLYHFLLTMNWWEFLGLVLLLYFLSNIVFGLFYSSLGAEYIVDTSSEPTANIF